MSIWVFLKLCIGCVVSAFFFFKQKTAYEMRISDWSSDVCSSDLECFQQAASDRAAAGQGDTQSISPNIKMPSVLRANIGFTSELNFAPSGFFSGWNLNLDYIYSKYRDPFTIVDLSQTPDIDRKSTRLNSSH